VISLKKIIFGILGLLIAVVIASLIIPGEVTPPKDTRVILEYTEKTYIAPSCFEQSGASNNIGEEDLAAAEEKEYSPHDSCTEKYFEKEESSLLVAFFKKLGILSAEWDEQEGKIMN